MGARWKGWIAFLTVLMAPVLLASSERPGITPAFPEPGPDDLTLQLEAEKTTYTLYEPVFLTATLENPTVSSVIADVRGLALVHKQMTLSVQEDDSEPVRYYSGFTATSVGSANRHFAPGDSMVETLTVFFNDVSQSLAFPHPGQYTIYGKMYLGNHPDPVYKEAPPVGIDVVEPSVSDTQLIEFIGSDKALLSLLMGGARTYCREISKDDCLANKRGLLAQFPESHYAPLVAFSAARAAVWEGSAKGTNYHLEAENLQDFLNRWPDYPRATVATRLLLRALHETGRDEEAMELIDRFEKEHPHRRSPRELIER